MEAFFFFILYLLETRSFPIEFLRQTMFMDRLYLILSPVVMIGCVIYAIVLTSDKNNNSPNNIILPVFVYSVLILFTTIFAQGAIRKAIGLVYPTLGLSALLLILSYKPVVFKQFINITSIAYFFVGVVHLLDCIFVFHSGEVYLLGNENLVSFRMQVGLMWCGISYYVNGHRVRFFLFIMMHVVALFYVFSATSLVAGMFFIILFILPSARHFLKRTNFFPFSLIILSLGFVFVIFTFLWGNIGVLATIFEEGLDKDMTLTGRTNIWPLVVSAIGERPILGYGILEDENVFVGHSAHNQYLQTLFNGGIITFISLWYIVWNYSKKMLITNNKNVIVFISALLSGMMVNYMAESPQFIYFIEIMIVGVGVTNIISPQGDQNNIGRIKFLK